jgi:hypothetical protein
MTWWGCVLFIADYGWILTYACLCAVRRPRAEAGKQTLPGHKTPLDGLLLTGDFTFPGTTLSIIAKAPRFIRITGLSHLSSLLRLIMLSGIGVPATAASGAITANNLVSVGDHWKMLDKIRLPQK